MSDESGDMQLIMLSYNEWQKMWELKLMGDPGRSVFVDGFRTMDNPEDFEKINGILGAWGFKREGIHWQDDNGGWKVLITKLRGGA